MGRAAKAGGIMAVLVAGAALLAWAAPAPTAAAQGNDCKIDGGNGICDAVHVDPSTDVSAGDTVTIRATSDSCNQGDGAPADVMFFTEGTEAEADRVTPVGEGVVIGTTSPPAVLEMDYTIPEDESGPMAIVLRCSANGEFTASSGLQEVTATTTTTEPATTTTAEPEVEVAAPPAVRVDEHIRPAISAVRSIGDVSTDAGLLAANLVIALLLILLAFPAELFNATFEEHYDEISGWFAGPKRALDRIAGDGTGSAWVPFGAVTAVAALLYAFLDPDLSLDEATLAMVLGVGLSIAVAVLISGAVARRFVGARHGDRGRLRIYPGALFVAAACVLVSRLVDFQPGYLYGVIAGFAFTAPLSRDEDGRNAARVAAAGLAVTVVCWLLLSPVRELMDDPEPSFLLVLVEAFLAAMFVGGLQALVFGFLPLRFLPGQKVWQWSRPVWAALFGIGVFGFLQVLLHPESSYEGSVVTMVVLFLGFAAASIAFWAYFRGRTSERRLDDLEVPAEDADHVEAE
jgi:hypothetical protein